MGWTRISFVSNILVVERKNRLEARDMSLKWAISY